MNQKLNLFLENKIKNIKNELKNTEDILLKKELFNKLNVYTKMCEAVLARNNDTKEVISDTKDVNKTIVELFEEACKHTFTKDEYDQLSDFDKENEHDSERFSMLLNSLDNKHINTLLSLRYKDVFKNPKVRKAFENKNTNSSKKLEARKGSGELKSNEDDLSDYIKRINNSNYNDLKEELVTIITDDYIGKNIKSIASDIKNTRASDPSLSREETTEIISSLNGEKKNWNKFMRYVSAGNHAGIMQFLRHPLETNDEIIRIYREFLLNEDLKEADDDADTYDSETLLMILINNYNQDSFKCLLKRLQNVIDVMQQNESDYDESAFQEDLSFLKDTVLNIANNLEKTLKSKTKASVEPSKYLKDTIKTLIKNNSSIQIELLKDIFDSFNILSIKDSTTSIKTLSDLKNKVEELLTVPEDNWREYFYSFYDDLDTNTESSSDLLSLDLLNVSNIKCKTVYAIVSANKSALKGSFSEIEVLQSKIQKYYPKFQLLKENSYSNVISCNDNDVYL